jgi:hypothetical protein
MNNNNHSLWEMATIMQIKQIRETEWSIHTPPATAHRGEYTETSLPPLTSSKCKELPSCIIPVAERKLHTDIPNSPSTCSIYSNMSRMTPVEVSSTLLLHLNHCTAMYLATGVIVCVKRTFFRNITPRCSLPAQN